MIHKKLVDLKEKGEAMHMELQETLIKYKTGIQKMEEAGSLIESGKVEEAIGRLHEVGKQVPGLGTVDYLLGKAYLKAGDQERARSHLLNFLERAKPYDERIKAKVEEAKSLLEGLSDPN